MYALVLLLMFGGSIQDLASDDFRTRQTAEARLDRWGWFVWPLLERRFGDLEQRMRARRIMRRMIGAAIDDPPMWLWHKPGGVFMGKGNKFTGLGWSNCPLLLNPAVLITGWPDREDDRGTWPHPVVTLLVYGVPDQNRVCWSHVKLRARTRWVATGLLRAGVPRSWVDVLLRQLRRNEKRWGE
jgi:hypothetical protein